jgi:hypothetical protein
MRILFIDDEPGTRLGPALNFYTKYFIVTAFDHLDHIPNDFDNYDVISFDNDLGGHIDKDTYMVLSRRLHRGELDLTGKKVYVHSMNPVASEKICQICKDAGAVIAEAIPFARMLAK